MPLTYKKYIDNLLESLYKTRKFLAETVKKKIIFLIHRTIYI